MAISSSPRSIAVVTGAASGIGSTVARYFAERGARVVGVDVNGAVTEPCAQLPGDGHRGIVTDLVAPSSAAEVSAETVSAVGDPADPGRTRPESLSSTPPSTYHSDRWQATIDVEPQRQLLRSAQAAGRVMLDAGYGRIINLASQAALVGLDQHRRLRREQGRDRSRFTRALAAGVGSARRDQLNAVCPDGAWRHRSAGPRRAGERGEKGDRRRDPGRPFRARRDEIAALHRLPRRRGCRDDHTGQNVAIDGALHRGLTRVGLRRDHARAAEARASRRELEPSSSAPGSQTAARRAPSPGTPSASSTVIVMPTRCSPVQSSQFARCSVTSRKSCVAEFAVQVLLEFGLGLVAAAIGHVVLLGDVVSAATNPRSRA